MSDLELNAQKDKDVEPVPDSPGRTQEPLQSHTFSLKNNAAGLSSDEHENPLNGTQPNPFVYSSVPAVPHAGNSLPSGALVNGPGSHPTSEVHCVLNKGTVLSNSVLDAAWQAEKDTSPEVLPPPSELQSDAWKNTAGPVVKTLATQPGVNTPLSHSEENESKLACSTLSGDSAEQMHISQPLTKQTIKTRSQRDVERSGSSSDDYDNTEVIKWHSARECFFHSDRRLETKVMHLRGRRHNTCTKTMSGCLEKVNNSCRHLCSCNDVENVDSGNKDQSLGSQSYIRYSVMPFKDLSRNTALDSEHHIYSTAQEGCNEENDPEDENSPKVEQLNTEQLEQDPLFFSCTICNVNFKEKRHFHRHMMYHLGKHNQVNSENDSHSFICAMCGRLFCDSNSLMRHIIIHQDRLEKLMEEIKGRRNSEIGDRATTAPCPQCAFACNCPKILVRHAKMRDNLRHYYFCEECNYITLTQQALEAHLHITHRPQYGRMTHANDVEGPGRLQFQCKMGFFTTTEKVELERHSEVEQSFHSDYKKFPDKLEIPRFKPPNLFALEERTHFSCFPKKDIRKSQTMNSSLHCVGKTTVSPYLWRINKHGKLLRQPAKKLDVETDLTCVEEEEDFENNDRKPFGSTKQANHPVILLSARNLKLDQMFCQNDPASGSLQVRANQNSPSTLKMSTPLHNTIGNMNGNILPRLSQRLKKQCAVRKTEKDCEGGDSLSDDTSEATGSCLEGSKNERNPYAQRYFRKRQSFSAKHQSPHTLKDEDDGDEDCSDIEQLIIKEECMETMACDDSSQLPVTSPSDSFDISPIAATEHKPCPYCPASFESGVGLANHVRGHLHRVGLSYSARHMVSPQQVALRDCQPRFRRRINTVMRKQRKAVQPETHGEHTCPLCSDWFDTKTGLSNHVRGHLRRIGRGVTSSNKSPLYILKKLLQDKKNVHQLHNKSCVLSRHADSPKFIKRNGLYLMRTGIPVTIKHWVRSPHPTLDRFVLKQERGTFSEEKQLQVEAQRDSMASSSTLVELLQAKEEIPVRHNQVDYAPRIMCDVTNDDMEETNMTSEEPSWNHDCEQAGYEQKKPRLRTGLKKKILPSLDTEICTLTCRFCDLVFHGPLSIQEDWIKHLQRHLLHTSMPHSGSAMVEVLGLHHRMQISMLPEHPGAE